jgi:hypothetical protein
VEIGQAISFVRELTANRHDASKLFWKSQANSQSHGRTAAETGKEDPSWMQIEVLVSRFHSAKDQFFGGALNAG